MDVDKVYCALCCDLLQFKEFNLKTIKSKLTNTLLLSLVKKVVGDFFSLHFYICLKCYDLINELDTIELRQAEIHKQLKTYIECNKLKNSQRESNIDNELSVVECTVINDIHDIHLFTSNNEDNNLNNELSQSLDFKCNNKIFDSELTTTNIGKCKIETKPLEVVSKRVIKKRGRRKKYPDIAKPHKCHCLKEFRTLWELKNHINSHNDYQPFICEICGLGYKHKPAFTRHMDMHNGINSFTCVYCNKSFTQKGSLVRHVPIHTGETQYQCDECGKRFLHHSSFNIHRLSHTGEKSYKCDVCGLALMSSSHLKRHMRIHTGEKKFVCNTCGRRFAERYNLAAHEKLHSNPKSILSLNTSYSNQVSKNKEMKKHSTTEN